MKGVIPTLVVFFVFKGKNFENSVFAISDFAIYLCGLCVVLGHIYPIIFKFKGGKGIATMLGVFFATNPLATLIVVVTAAISWLLFKYGSMASFICVTVLTVVEGIKAKSLLTINESKTVCILLFSIFILTWFAHRKNIERLLVGKESKVDLIKSVKKKYKQSNR
jgi:glycerol-3-phosphate acyltransferase PlsY